MPMRIDATAMVTTESQSAGEESSCLAGSVGMKSLEVAGSVGMRSLEVAGWVSSGVEGDVTGESVGFSAEGSLVAGEEGSVADGVAEESSFGIVFCSKAPQVLQVRLDRPSFSAVGALTVVHAP